MFKCGQIAAAMMLCVFLTSCASTNRTRDEEADLKVNTAKINAQLGIAYLGNKNIQRSKQKLLLALEQAPEIPEPWYSMGYFMETTGNKREANTYYLRAVSIAPERGDVQNNYGTFLCRSGDYKGAIQHFMLAVKDKSYLDPADAYENAGMCALKIPDQNMARHYFNTALAQDPTRPSTLLALAELDYNTGNYREASRQISSFKSLFPATRQSQNLAARIEKKLTADHPENGKQLNLIAAKKQQLVSRHPSKRIHHTYAMIKKSPRNNKMIALRAIRKHSSAKLQPQLAWKKGKLVRV